MKRFLTACVLVAAVLTNGLCVSAAPAKKSAAKKAPVVRAAAPRGPVQTAFRRSPYVGAIMLSETGGANRRWQTLFSERADQPAYPASVTKLMTLLLVLEDVKAGKYALDDTVTATPDVARCEPSWVGLKTGDRMTVRDLAMALMVESANDAAIALAVHSSGSFDGFVARMNARAAVLGMRHTTYYNPNGLPPNAGKRYPWKSFNVSTAGDQALLAQRLVTMPDVFSFTSVKTCDLIKTPTGYRVSVTRRANAPLRETQLATGETLVKALRNHNNVMRTDKLKIVNADGREAIDGLKTGYIDAGGSSMILTGTRNGRRTIVVVLGSATAKERDTNAQRLLLDGLGASAL